MKLHSPTAAEYEASGHTFDADLHIIESRRDGWTFRWLEALLGKYDAFIVAHSWHEEAVTGDVSVELEFGKDSKSRQEMLKCKKEYEKGPPKRPRVGYDQGRLHQRLYNGRFYRLPDGRAFLLLGKWDMHGNRWGKVQAGPEAPNGVIPLMNQLVPEEELRRCPLIPRHEEPFSSDKFTGREDGDNDTEEDFD